MTTTESNLTVRFNTEFIGKLNSVLLQLACNQNGAKKFVSRGITVFPYGNNHFKKRKKKAQYALGVRSFEGRCTDSERARNTSGNSQGHTAESAQC